MKSQILFTTLSVATTLATVESFHMIPIGKSSARPSLSLASSLQEDNSSSSSDGFGLRKMSKDLMQQKEEKRQKTEQNPIENEIARGYMSLSSSSTATPKPLKMSTWKKEDAKKEELARLEFLFESSDDYVTDAEPLSWQ
ncbi:MAG: hypothetical protein SGBAC_006161 [Bacillariaceae sp.]